MQWDRLRIVHGLLFAVGVAAAVLDLASSRGFDESTLASSVSLPLAGLALGVAYVDGTAGRPIDTSSSPTSGWVVGAAASALSTMMGPFGSPGRYSRLDRRGLAGLAALVAIAARVPTPPSPPRTSRHRLALSPLFGFTFITLIGAVFAISDVSLLSIILSPRRRWSGLRCP